MYIYIIKTVLIFYLYLFFFILFKQAVKYSPTLIFVSSSYCICLTWLFTLQKKWCITIVISHWYPIDILLIFRVFQGYQVLISQVCLEYQYSFFPPLNNLSFPLSTYLYPNVNCLLFRISIVCFSIYQRIYFSNVNIFIFEISVIYFFIYQYIHITNINYLFF